jgi:hypothetical protein
VRASRTARDLAFLEDGEEIGKVYVAEKEPMGGIDDVIDKGILRGGPKAAPMMMPTAISTTFAPLDEFLNSFPMVTSLKPCFNNTDYFYPNLRPPGVK